MKYTNNTAIVETINKEDVASAITTAFKKGRIIKIILITPTEDTWRYKFQFHRDNHQKNFLNKMRSFIASTNRLTVAPNENFQRGKYNH